MPIQAPKGENSANGLFCRYISRYLRVAGMVGELSGMKVEWKYQIEHSHVVHVTRFWNVAATPSPSTLFSLSQLFVSIVSVLTPDPFSLSLPPSLKGALSIHSVLLSFIRILTLFHHNVLLSPLTSLYLYSLSRSSTLSYPPSLPFPSSPSLDFSFRGFFQCLSQLV